MNLARNSTCNIKQSGKKHGDLGVVHCVTFGYHGFETALLYMSNIKGQTLKKPFYKGMHTGRRYVD